MRCSASPPGNKAVLTVFCIQANIPSSTIITPGLLHSQPKTKPVTKVMTAVSQANMSQGLLSWAPDCLWSGEWRGFLPQGNLEPGASQRMFLLPKHRVGRGSFSGYNAGRAVVLADYSSLQEQLVSTTKPVPNPACTAKDPFEKGWNVSDSITAAVSLLHFCVESPLAKYH